MIEHDFDEDLAILYVRPKAPLERADSEKLAGVVDPFLSRTGELAGLIIEAPAFPGWASFGSMIAHLRFVRDHHRQGVTDSSLGNLAKHLVSHFVPGEIRQFPARDLEAARQWISS